MSYNKNTWITSELDARKSTLDSLQYPYKLETLGTVAAHGINDDYSRISHYPIRKLSCDKFVIVEQMQRAEDCDTDDFLVSYEFLPGELYNWNIEVFDCEEVDSHSFLLEKEEKELIRVALDKHLASLYHAVPLSEVREKFALAMKLKKLIKRFEGEKES